MVAETSDTDDDDILYQLADPAASTDRSDQEGIQILMMKAKAATAIQSGTKTHFPILM